MRQLLVRLDRTTRTPDIWLFAVATGLGVFDFTVLLGKGAKVLALAAPLTSLSPIRPEASLHPGEKKKAIDLAQWTGGAAGLR